MSVFRHGLTFVPLRLSAQVGRADQSCGAVVWPPLHCGVCDPLAHAEVKAMAEAAASLDTWNLADCTLVVTLEPCPMCAGACLQTHIGRIVFGAWDAKLGACGSVWDIPRDPHVGLVPEVIGGVREAECGRLMTDFFARRR